jgi:formylglycine-generating enzyme required for sulfatase activity
MNMQKNRISIYLNSGTEYKKGEALMKLLNKNNVSLILTAAFALIFNGLCHAAQDNVQTQKTKTHAFKALVIGINEYSDKKIKSFSGSGNDAQKIAKTLSENYGFQVKTLINEKATKNEIVSSLSQLAELPQDSSVAIVFLGAGEKDQLYDYTYWIPQDAKSGDVLTYIDHKQVEKQIKKIRSRHLFLISSASYPAGGISGPGQIEQEMSKRLEGQSRWILLSGKNTDVPDPSDQSSGAFGKAVLSSLKKNQAPVLSAHDFIKGVQSSITAKSGIKPLSGTFDSGQSAGGEFLFAKPEAQAAIINGESKAAIAGDGTGKDAILNISSSIQGADIYLNGIPWGKTPLKDKKVIAGTYSVKVSKDGYEPAQSEVTIAAGETKEVPLDLVPLKPIEGTLKIMAVPSESIISFTDDKIKYKPGMPLAPGKYQVVISAFGYDEQKLDINVASGVKLEKTVTLNEASLIQNSLGMKFVKILPGSFEMGSSKDVLNRGADETIHTVKISKKFYMQATEVTVGQWSEFIKATSYKSDSETSGNGPWIWIGHKWEQDPAYSWKKPGFQQTDLSPVVCVSWNDANKFIAWLNSKKEGIYRLPTEAEWEYAARAGTKDNFFTGQCLSPKQANFDATSLWGKCPTGNATKMTVKTSSFPANQWGLYDMHGNVLEWCRDWHGDYKTGENTDPTGAKTGTQRVARGGAWDSYVYQCRSAKRFSFAPEESYNNLGFRLVAE